MRTPRQEELAGTRSGWGSGLVAGERRHVDLRAVGHQRVGGQHHVVLPTVEPADPGVRTLHRPQPAPVAVGPRGALGVGRLQLAVLADDLAVGADEHERAVHRAVRERVALDHPDRDVDAGFACRRAELVGLRAWHIDRRLDVPRLEVALLGGAEGAFTNRQ